MTTASGDTTHGLLDATCGATVYEDGWLSWAFDSYASTLVEGRSFDFAGGLDLCDEDGFRRALTGRAVAAASNRSGCNMVPEVTSVSVDGLLMTFWVQYTTAGTVGVFSHHRLCDDDLVFVGDW